MQNQSPSSSSPREPRTGMLTLPIERPLLTYIILAAISVVFLAQLYFYQNNPNVIDPITKWGAMNFTRILDDNEYYRLFTAMFIHLSETHFFSNALSLYLIGRGMEAFFGRIRFGIIYFLGGLSGSLASFMFSRGSSAGASGAIFAIVGAQLIFLYQNRQILGTQGRSWLQQTIVVIGLNLFIGIAAAATPSAVAIDNWGHVGGFFAGIVLAWFIGPQYQLRQEGMTADKLRVVDASPRRLTWRVSALYLAGMVAALIYSVVNLR